MKPKTTTTVATTAKQRISKGCPEKYQNGEINAKEFFVFNSHIVWCNVFKSASTRYVPTYIW